MNTKNEGATTHPADGQGGQDAGADADTGGALPVQSQQVFDALTLLRATLESTTDGVFAVDQNLKVIEYNQNFIKMWNIPPAVMATGEQQEIAVQVCRHFSDPQAFMARVTEIYAAESADSFDVLELADGRVFERYSRVQTVDGRKIGRVWTFRDISKRRRAEDALRDETRILELLDRTGRAIAATLDIQKLAQTVTDAATELAGAEFGAFFHAKTLAGDDVFLLYALAGAPREAFDRLGHPRATPLFAPTFEGQPPIRLDDVLADPRYGRMTPLHGMPPGHLPVRSYLAVPVISRSGDVLGGLFFGHSRTGMFTERTERLIVGVAAQAAVALDNARLYEAAQNAAAEREKLLESERAAREEAERMSKLKDEFLAMLAHELRNPLAPVSSAAQLLQLVGADQNRVRQASKVISRQVQHMTNLLDDLLDVSRVTRGLATLDKAPLDLRHIISGAIEQTRSLVEEKRHALTLRLGAGPAFVLGDETRLVQIVVNLLNNAAKYTPDGGEIILRMEAAGDDVTLSVRDNGIGMSAALLPHVFDLFTQAERSPDRAQGGLGLGLALVKTLVKLHGGEVRARSDGPGAGSEFTLRLPRLIVPEAAAPSTQAEPPRSHDAAPRLHVMIVDDNVDAADMLALILEQLGFAVVAEHDAFRAIERARVDAPDVCLLDIGLPGIDGHELARRLRKLPGMARAKFVAITGYGQPADRESSLAAGFDYHFVKPVDPGRLADLLVKFATA